MFQDMNQSQTGDIHLWFEPQTGLQAVVAQAVWLKTLFTMEISFPSPRGDGKYQLEDLSA